MGYHLNCIDWPVKMIWFIFIFNLTCPLRTPPKGPGGLPMASQWPPKRVISRIQPKPGLWGIIRIVSTGPSKFFIYFHFWPHLSPQDPSEGSWWPPNGLPKGSFLESNQNLGYGVSSESSWLAKIFFDIFYFWPHLSPTDSSEGSQQSLKRVTSRIESKHQLLGINRINRKRMILLIPGLLGPPQLYPLRFDTY